MKVGMLTGGGDCPGLNAVLRAAVRKATVHYGDELVGFRDGWKGVVENLTIGLDIERMRGTLPRGGTVLGSSRLNIKEGSEVCDLIFYSLEAYERVEIR